METKNEFYNKLSDYGKECYDEVEKIRKHSDRFRYLMDHPKNEKYPHFSPEDLQFLCEEDLSTVNEIYPDDGSEYMDW